MNNCGLIDEIMNDFDNDIFKLERILKSKYYVRYKVKENLNDEIEEFLLNLPFEENEIPIKDIVLCNNSKSKEYIKSFFDYLELKFPIGNSKEIFKEERKSEKLKWDSTKCSEQIRCIRNLLIYKYTKLYTMLRNEYGERLTTGNNYYICPYCKRNYINVIVSENKQRKIKPDLDHFYPKSLYPFLAVTLSNLIPSCLTCNQRCKGNIDTFEIKPHIYPPDNVFKLLNFTYNHFPKKIGIKIDEKFDKFNTTKTEVENHLETFLIEETYSGHTEILDLIKEKYDKYSESKMDDLSTMIEGLNKTNIKNIVFYEYEKLKKDDNKEPLSKLKLDLYKDIVK